MRQSMLAATSRRNWTDSGSRLEHPGQYCRIGISAVAAAVEYQGERKNSAYAASGSGRLAKGSQTALVHDEGVREDTIENLFDDEIRRRFGELISRVAENE
jgi:hypothetical protein